MSAFAAVKVLGALSILDLAVVAIAIALLALIAWWSGREEKDTQDFFLGGRRVPAFVACLSFVATEVSAVTITAVPFTGFSENWQYLQFFIGAALARIFVAYLFIPKFFTGNWTSIYEFLRARFGTQTQYAGSVFFFITRLLGSGVRLFAACEAVALILGLSLAQALLLFTIVAIGMIAFGGIKAVVWAGAYEAAVFYLAGLAVLGYLALNIEGGPTAAWASAAAAGKLKLFNLQLNLSDPKTLWAAILNALFLNLAVFGTDQEFVLRLLTVRTRRASQKAIVGTIAAALPLVCIYLAIGTLLFVFYQQRPGTAPAGPEAKRVLSYFVVDWLPTGLKGLVLAAVILASIDSPLASLASSFVSDIYRPVLGRGRSERHYLWVSRLSVVGFGIILALIAYACQPIRNILWFAFEIVSVTGGPMLGIFLFGLLTRQRANLDNVLAMITSAVAMTTLLILSRIGAVGFGWSWLIVLGTATTFGLSWFLARCHE